MTKSTLRQRKKDRTRARLIEVSQRLFAEQGYDATTLEQICDEAEVSVPTLLAYFESKERLALTPDYDALAEFRARIEDPDRGESTIDLWRAHVRFWTTFAAEHRHAYLRHYRFQASSPAFVRGMLALLQQYEDVVADGLARDLGAGREVDLPTRLVAAMLVFGDQTAVRHWITAGGKEDLAQVCDAVIDFVVERFPDVVVERIPDSAATAPVRRAN